MRQYMDKATAAEELQVKSAFISRVFREIHELTGNGKRYGPYTFRGSGKSEQIRSAALTDYMKYREALNDENMGKFVPDFDVRAAEIELGISNAEIVKVDAQEVANLVFAKIAATISGAVSK